MPSHTCTVPQTSEYCTRTETTVITLQTPGDGCLPVLGIHAVHALTRNWYCLHANILVPAALADENGANEELYCSQRG